MGNRIVLENFDLHIGPGKNGVYPVTVLSSPAGEALDPVRIPMASDDETMRRWMQRLRNGLIEGDDLIALGQRLTGYLLPPGSIRDLYQRSLGMVDVRGTRLRLRLRISPPELSALPWEYAYDQEANDFLVLNPRTVLVRYHSQPVPPYSIASRLPVSILVLVSSPPGPYVLEASTEILNLLEVLSRLLDEHRVRLDLLLSASPEERCEIEALVAGRAGVRLLPGPASIDALRNVLRQDVRVLHYIGHGRFDDQAGGALLLANDRESYSLVGAQTLARELRGTGTALVVLNACQSATESTTRSYMGLAPSLIRAGVPAVVAMQYAIVDRSAMSFSQALYGALADGWPLDAAVTEGRKAISARVTPDYADWGIPVLFMRSSDGVLWEERPFESEKPQVITDTSEMERRFEAAMPQVSKVGVRTEVRVMVALPDSPGLRAYLPSWTDAGDVISKKDVVSGCAPLEFLLDPATNEPLPITACLEVTAPDFEIERPTKNIRVSPKLDSGVVTFFLTPRVRQRHGRVLVELFQDEQRTISVGSLTLLTEVKAWHDDLVATVWQIAALPLSLVLSNRPAILDPRISKESGGGVSFHGSVEVSGDVIGRDKIVHGDEIRGDKIEGHIGDVGAGAQVAIGRDIRQTVVQTPARLTDSERAELTSRMAELQVLLADLDLPESSRLVGQELVSQLEVELTKTGAVPDASMIKVAGEWLLRNIPALADALKSLFVDPIVGKVIRAAGEVATTWARERFGSAV